MRPNLPAERSLAAEMADADITPTGGSGGNSGGGGGVGVLCCTGGREVVEWLLSDGPCGVGAGETAADWRTSGGGGGAAGGGGGRDGGGRCGPRRDMWRDMMPVVEAPDLTLVLPDGTQR